MVHWLLLISAVGATEAHLEAVVAADLRSLRGTLRLVDPPAEVVVVDPLATLPDPPHELDRIRTYPGPPNLGSVRFERTGEHTWAFEATLPRRWGDLGSTAHGLFANGAWYPQPLVDGALPLLDWRVRVELPPDTAGALGDVTGADVLAWSGTAERASLAVVPRGRVTALHTDGWDITLLTRGPPRRALRHVLPEQLALGEVGEAPRALAIVEAPLRRRLARPGPGLAYLSDRTWAVFPWFRRMHHVAAVRAMLSASSSHPDPFVRELEAAALSTEHARRLARKQAVDLLGLTRWLTLVDAALYDQEMAFRSELFRWAHPSDRVRDDLAERFRPTTAGTIVAAQLRDRYGPTALRDVGRRLAMGWPLPDAAARAGVQPAWIDAWRAPYVDQDYTLDVDGAAVTVRRDAPPEAPPEVVTVDADGARLQWQTPAGPAAHTWQLDQPPRHVRLDPFHHLGQRSRLGELRPPPIRWTLGGALTGINLSEGFATAYAVLSVRRADDTRNAWRLWGFTNQRDRLRVRLSWTRFAGPLVRGATREHAFAFSVEGSWLNPRFATFDGAPVSVGGSVGWSWDNRVYSLFPMKGSAVEVGVSAGGVPATGDRYVRASGTVIGLFSPHPRHVLAGQLSGGWALTDIPQRRLTFGGAGGVRGIPDIAVQTELQAVASMEYRVVPLREVSVPLLWLTWVRELQLTVGIDMGTGRADEVPIAAASANVGIGVIADNLGVSPAGATVTFGVPLGWRGFDLPDTGLPFELYLSWGTMY